MSSLSGIARNSVPHQIILFGVSVQLIEFKFCGTLYSFVITQWQGRDGMREFIQLFHDTPRDITQFGKVVLKRTGSYEYLENLTDVIPEPTGIPDKYVVGPGFEPMTQFQKLKSRDARIL